MNYSDPDEVFPVVDEEGKTIGYALRSVCHDGKSKLLHPVIHLHIFNSAGKLFLQKRSMKKDTQPGKWDTSVGGHVAPGEEITEALRREASEEIGITGFQPEFLGRYVWESPVERELVNSFMAVSDQLPVINPDEIDEGRFWSLEEIKSSKGKAVFTPNFEKEFNDYLLQCFLSCGERQ